MIDPERLLRESFPGEFLQDTLRCLLNSYQMAISHCRSRYAPQEAHDLYPHERRAIFDGNWRKIAAGYPSVSAGAEVNHNKGAFHTEVSSGGVILTANVVDNPLQLVRHARFRKTLAENGQLTLDIDCLKEDKGDRSNVFAILIHGPSQANLPTFAQIVFPDRSCNSYLTPRIDLFGDYPDILSTFQTPEEEVKPTPIQIKKDIPMEHPLDEQA